MSQQTTPLEASGFGIDVVRSLKAAIANAVTALQIRRQAHADAVVRSIIARYYSDEDLTRHGWSAENIRRLKSR